MDMRSRIYELCRQRGMTRDELARLSGVTRRALDKYEANGLERAQLGTVASVARALGCSIEELYEK